MFARAPISLLRLTQHLTVCAVAREALRQALREKEEKASPLSRSSPPAGSSGGLGGAALHHFGGAPRRRMAREDIMLAIILTVSVALGGFALGLIIGYALP